MHTILVDLMLMSELGTTPLESSESIISVALCKWYVDCLRLRLLDLLMILALYFESSILFAIDAVLWNPVSVLLTADLRSEGGASMSNTSLCMGAS